MAKLRLSLKKISRYIRQRPLAIIAVVFIIALTAELGLYGYWRLKAKSISPQRAGSSLEEYAKTVMANCASQHYRPACYDKEIPKLMKDISMEDAFGVTRLVQQQDPDYWYCHVLGHNVSAEEVKKDPSKWKEVIPRCPSGMCSNGCVHGALQERFRKEKFPANEQELVMSELTDLCEDKPSWHPTGMEQATCYHALGHLLMYITDADAKKSVAACGRMAKKSDGRDLLTVCYDGVFMQLFQPLEPEDIALIKGKAPVKEDVASFCAPYEPRVNASCWSESWPLHWEEIKESKGLVRFCSVLAPGMARERCYNGMFFVMAAQFRLDEGKITAFCGDLPLSVRGQCFANAAGRMIETDSGLIDRALTLCRSAKEFGGDKECFSGLRTYATFNFHAGSPEQDKLCRGLPASVNCAGTQGAYNRRGDE